MQRKFGPGTTAVDEASYETDFYSGTNRRASLLRSGHADLADLSNIAEEIETLGYSEAAALESTYRLIAMHLLKLLFQPQRSTPSWSTTIARKRIRLAAVSDRTRA